MKILISGGTGLVGSELGKNLVQKGHEIFILTRSKEKANKHCPFPQTPITYEELSSWPTLKELDHIINLAGANLTEQRWNKTFKETIRRSRVDTTEQLVQLANDQCPQLKSFISTSAIGIYGHTGEEVVTEEYPLSYGFLGQVCQDWEAPLKALRKNIRPIILRVGIVLSEKGGALSEMVPPLQAGVGGPLTSGKQFMSWIDIDDLVNMYTYAVENTISGTFNAVAPQPARNLELTQAICDHLGVRSFLPVPFFALRTIVGEMAHHLIESQNISSEKIQKLGFRFTHSEVKSSVQQRVPQLKNMQRRRIYEQWLPKSKEEIFPFFSDAHNLEKITPDKLNFKILSVSDTPVQEGTIIKYKLRIDGIPVNWTTMIQKWEPPHRFVDNQEKGPYRKWHHTHTFQELGSGTLMTDQVDLEIPLGKLGFGAASWKVLRDVDFIFNYRREVIYDMFSNS
jgi:uncharacterized protein